MYSPKARPFHPCSSASWPDFLQTGLSTNSPESPAIFEEQREKKRLKWLLYCVYPKSLNFLILEVTFAAVKNSVNITLNQNLSNMRPINNKVFLGLMALAIVVASCNPINKFAKNLKKHTTKNTFLFDFELHFRTLNF